jgi:hypothetical protein
MIRSIALGRVKNMRSIVVVDSCAHAASSAHARDASTPQGLQDSFHTEKNRRHPPSAPLSPRLRVAYSHGAYSSLAEKCAPLQ